MGSSGPAARTATRRVALRAAGTGGLAALGLAGVVTARERTSVSVGVLHGTDVGTERSVAVDAVDAFGRYLEAHPDFSHGVDVLEPRELPLDPLEYDDEVAYNAAAADWVLRHHDPDDGTRFLVLHTRDGLDDGGLWNSWGYGGGLVALRDANAGVLAESLNASQVIDAHERRAFAWHELAHTFGVHHGFARVTVGEGLVRSDYEEATAEAAGYVRDSFYIRELPTSGSITTFRGTGFVPRYFTGGDGRVRNGKHDVDGDSEVVLELSRRTVRRADECVAAGRGTRTGDVEGLRRDAGGRGAPSL